MAADDETPEKKTDASADADSDYEDDVHLTRSDALKRTMISPLTADSGRFTAVLNGFMSLVLRLNDPRSMCAKD